MDENNTPQPEEPTPAPEPEVPATPPTPAPEPTPTAAPTPEPQPTAASTYASPPAGGKGPVPFSGAPDPSIPQDQRTQALLCWILGLFVGFVSPLIFLLISKDKPFVYHHAAQALTINIVMAVAWIIVFVIAMLTCVGFILYPILAIYALVMLIMGAIAANAGSTFEPPVTGNLSKTLFKA